MYRNFFQNLSKFRFIFDQIVFFKNRLERISQIQLKTGKIYDFKVKICPNVYLFLTKLYIFQNQLERISHI